MHLWLDGNRQQPSKLFQVGSNPARCSMNIPNKAKLRAIEWFQTEAHVHPLTCGQEDCRADLQGFEDDGMVMLSCPECGEVQMWVPEVVYRLYMRQLAFGVAAYGRKQ